MCLAKYFIECRAYHHFGGRPTRAFRIGGIGKQQVHPARGELCQLGIIGGPAIHRREIEFEIAHVNDEAGWRGDAQPDGIRNGM